MHPFPFALGHLLSHNLSCSSSWLHLVTQHRQSKTEAVPMMKAHNTFITRHASSFCIHPRPQTGGAGTRRAAVTWLPVSLCPTLQGRVLLWGIATGLQGGGSPVCAVILQKSAAIGTSLVSGGAVVFAHRLFLWLKFSVSLVPLDYVQQKMSPCMYIHVQ